MKGFKKKLMVSALAVTMVAPVAAVSASETYGDDTGVVEGYTIIGENDGIVEVDIQGEFTIDNPFQRISYGSFRGTWTSGNANLGLHIFSSVTGNSSGNGRAQGRGTVRNGNGVENTGGWQRPGDNSRGQVSRTVGSGANRAFWGLRAP